MTKADEMRDFDVTSEPDRPDSVVRVKGEVDECNTPVLAEHLEELVEHGARAIVLDLSRATFIDSTGLTALVAGMKRLRAVDGRLVVGAVSPNVQKALEITGLYEPLVEG